MNPKLKTFLKMQLLILGSAFIFGIFTLGGLGGSASTSALSALGAGDYGGIATGAGLAIGLAGLGAGVGMGTAGAAAIGAITEKPEVFGKSLIYVVLIEAVAIYGLVISFLLIQQLSN
jgi:V/A-type H+-transporting ATPase subunit K